ncbi:MAG: protein kinase domain-containing protein, partial [Kofleriaceae bacterium]
AALTIASSPGSTILPAVEDISTAGSRALAALEQLAHRAAGERLAIGETLGEGGMGVVRSAKQVALDRTVAVKQLRPGQAGPGAALDLLREAWVTGSLEHPNIVPVHFLELDAEGRPVIVLKRIEGVSWQQLIGDPSVVASRFGATDAVAWNIGILIHVLDALRFAHSRGVIHRDLKPANVMVGAFGEVYLLDWGLAVALVDNGSGRMPLASDAKKMAGTPAYMAPEMLGGDPPRLSVRTDVYLAGSVLFEIITGTPPHRGTTALEILGNVVASRPVLPDDAPLELARICRRAIDADPEQRFPSIDELQQALRGYLEHRGSARLAETARGRLDELLDALASGERRDEVYRLFGACRFGFHEALIMWRDNHEARTGLRRAIIAVAEYELGEDPRAAVTLLGELDDPPAELLARARSAVAAAVVRTEQLQLLARQHDPSIGTRTRMFIVIVLGGLFSVMSLLTVLGLLTPTSYVDHVVLSLVLLSAVLGLGFWARATLSRTLVNRRLLASITFVFVVQLGLSLAAPRLELTLLQLQHSFQLLWAVVAGIVTITVDRSLLPGALTFAIGFVVALLVPQYIFHVIAANCVVFTIFTAWTMRPAAHKHDDPNESASDGSRG